MNKKYIPIYKPLGLTPFDLIVEFKKKFPLYKDEKIGYAGRLDPMASGIIILLIGEENKKKDIYLNLDKKYTIQVLFGIDTDTYDLLGKIISVYSEKKIAQEEIIECLNFFQGEVIQQFPPYSSKRVNGKPLFYWARKKMIDEIDIPFKKRYISSIILKKYELLKKNYLEKTIMAKLKLVRGDFRQDEIIEIWEEFFLDQCQSEYLTVELDVECSSGTYMRKLAYDIGKKLDTGALVFDIKRIKIGDITLKDCMYLNLFP